MAVKRISWIEENVEKLVFGGACAALLGVVAWQFLGGPTTVKVGTQDVPIGKAFEGVESAAKDLEGRMNDANIRMPPAGPMGELANAFKGRLGGPVSPTTALAWAGGRGQPVLGSGGVTVVANDNDQGFVIPQVPKPGAPVAVWFMSTISEAEANAIRAAGGAGASFLPAAAPYDISAVSVETSFSGVDLRDAFSVKPAEGSGRRALPANWWQENTAILSVELIRETRQSDGSFGEQIVVPPLPARRTLLPFPTDPAELAQALPTKVADAKSHEGELLRPRWYDRPTINNVPMGEEWVAPGDIEAAGNQRAQSQRDQNLLNTKLNERDAIARSIERVERGGQTGPTPPPPGGGGGGGRGPGPGRGPGAGGGNPNAEEIARLRRNLARVDSEIAEIRKRIEAASGRPADSSTRPPIAPADQGLAPLLRQANVQIWSHDPTAKAGSTYRYRVRLGVTNPFFGRGLVGPDQRELVSRPTLTVESDWSAPVKVEGTERFFITGASDTAQPNAARNIRATARVFHFHFGYWRGVEVPLEPGDALVASIRVPDIDRIAAMIPGAAPAVPGGEGDRPIPGGGPGRAPVPGGGTPVPPAGPEKGGKQPSQPAGPSIPFKTIEVRKDVFLLDVASMPVLAGAAGPTVLAYLRDDDGTIVTRNPKAEEASALLRRLITSGDAGRVALEEAIRGGRGSAGGGDRPVPPPGGGDQNPPPPPPGGGGGGGGGGG